MQAQARILLFEIIEDFNTPLRCRLSIGYISAAAPDGFVGRAENLEYDSGPFGRDWILETRVDDAGR